MKRCQVLPFGLRLDSKFSQLMKTLESEFASDAKELLYKVVSATENAYIEDYKSIFNHTQHMFTFEKDILRLGMLSQLNEDNIYCKYSAELGVRLLIIAANLHEAGEIFDQLLDELRRLTHKSILKV